MLSSRKPVQILLFWLLAGGMAVVLAFALDNRVDTALDVSNKPVLRQFAWWCSKLGEGWVPGLVGILLCVLFIIFRRPDAGAKILFIALTCEFTGFCAIILRLVAGRARPHAGIPQGFYGPWHDGHWIAGEYDFSAFPSGHAAMAVGLAAATWLVHRGWGAVASLYALAVIWSRVALQAHHLSDIVASIVLAIPLAVLCKKILLPFLDSQFSRRLRANETKVHRSSPSSC